MTTEAKFESVDGYTVVDLAGAARLVGPIRSAKKVLQRTTIDLVRHNTYACAVHGLNASGAAAALNYDRSSEADAPFEHFARELGTWAEENTFIGSTNMGLSPAEAGPTLSASAARIAETVALSAASSLPKQATNIVIASPEEEPQITAALDGREFSQVADLAEALSSGAHAVLVRGKTGVLDHAVLEDTNVKSIIGLQPLTLTARGLAVATRAGVLTIPSFISAAGPTLAALGATDDQISTLTKKVLINLASTGDVRHLFVSACEHAEAHMRTLTDSLPFGRPLAP